MIGQSVGFQPVAGYVLFSVRVSCMYSVRTTCQLTDFYSLVVLLVLWSQAFRWAKLPIDLPLLWLQEVVKTCSLLIMTTPCWVIRCIVIYTQKSQFQEQVDLRLNSHKTRSESVNHAQPPLPSTSNKAAEGSELSLLRKNSVSQVQGIPEQSSGTSTNTSYPPEGLALRSELELVQGRDTVGLAV